MGVAPDWVANYCGIPFKELGLDRSGCNCWGLARLVLSEQCGIDLPSYVGGYSGISKADASDIKRLIEGGLRSDGWVELDWRDGDNVNWGCIKSFDGILLRIEGRPIHMAVMVAPRLMLHTMVGEDSHPERVDDLRWRNRISGFYRHERLM